MKIPHDKIWTLKTNGCGALGYCEALPGALIPVALARILPETEFIERISLG